MSGAIGTFSVGRTPIGGEFVQSYTAVDIIRLALLHSGAVKLAQTIYAEDVFLGFDMLNCMLAQWSRKRWLIWHLLDLSVPTPTFKKAYSIGSGGDFDFPRPDRLEYAYFRQFTTGGDANNGAGPVDFPLTLLQSMEDYASYALKFLTTWPQGVFYDAAFPLGQILPVPIPNVANSELHVLIKDTLNQFPTPTTPVNLPPEYFEAIWSNLALRVAAAYPDAEIDPFTVGQAKAALSTIRTANAQVPRLRMPAGMTRPPLFNIFSYQQY
jgi:hypothetical protein